MGLKDVFRGAKTLFLILGVIVAMIILVGAAYSVASQTSLKTALGKAFSISGLVILVFAAMLSVGTSPTMKVMRLRRKQPDIAPPKAAPDHFRKAEGDPYFALMLLLAALGFGFFFLGLGLM